MGIPLRGRDFGDRDGLDRPGVAIVNEALARRFFPGEEPIGKRLTVRYGLKSDFEVIGVAGDVRTGTLEHSPEPAVYLSVGQEPTIDVALVVRGNGAATDVAGAVRAAVGQVDPDQGVANIQPLTDVIAGAVARPRVQAGVFGSFGVLALLVAAVGLYGVIGYGVEQRQREIGIRLALGAAPRAVLLGVIRDGVGLAVIGAAVGGVGALVAGGGVKGLLFSTSPHDPVLLASVIAVLIGVSVLAASIPARRAMRTDPLVALRND
jgi:ABC-type antimicrobial peptide transport system permease subunit